MTTMSLATPTNDQSVPSTDSAYGPALGIFPRTAMGRFFFLWGTLNVILALLPVYNILGNSAEVGFMNMPITVIYCYAVFSLNCILGVAYYLTRGSAWVAMCGEFAQKDTAKGEAQ